MVKTLQKKFTVAAMTAITILIAVLLGTVNIVNVVRLNNRNENLMDMLSNDMRIPMDDYSDEFEGDKPEYMPATDMNATEYPQERPEDRNRGGFRMFDPMLNEDDRMSAVYFVVRFDENDNIIFSDVSHISSVDENKAAEYAAKVLSQEKSKGKIDDFKYVVSKSADGHGKTIVFLDINKETQTILAVALASVGIGLVCWIFMLFIIIALSKKAIKPIAANIERQKQFITDAGHEIKTPLAIILANTDAMELHNGENKWSKNIRKQTSRLSELMQRMLSLSKMDEGNVKLKFEELDISKILSDAVDSFSEPAKKRKLVFEKNIEENLVCKADKESIIQLFNILIDNAVKYADEETDIKIKLKKHDKHAGLSISNICSSLPDIEPEKMFDRFYRGDSARTQKGGGFGIGLSVARAIVELHKGKIGAEFADEHTICIKLEF